jgi:hypothetical protein
MDKVQKPNNSVRNTTLHSHRPGRALTQAFSRQPSTPAARVRARVTSCGICGGQSDTRADFLRVLQFPLPIDTQTIAPQSTSSIIWGWTISQTKSAVPSTLTSVSPHEKQ